MKLSHWPADTSRPILDLTAGDALRQTAAEAPDRTALVEVAPPGAISLAGAGATDRRWTYAQLLAEAENCAHWLLESYTPGERVCVWAPNIPEWVILQYGAALSGLVLVTANPALRASELRYVLGQSQSAGLIYAGAFRGTDMKAIAREVGGDLRGRFCIKDWQSAVRSRDRSGDLPIVHPTDPAQIQYTSGTTGQPKGALLHHRGLVTNASFVAERAGLDQGVFISAMPLFHTAGSAMSVLGCVTTRSTFVLPVIFDPDLMLKAMERERATVSGGVPTMLIALVEQAAKEDYDLSCLRTIWCGGAPVPIELLRRVEQGLGCNLLNVYGQTELSPIVCQTAADDTADHRASTSGRPLPQVEVRIADLQTGDVTLVGAEGAIQARGYQSMMAYFNMPEATSAAIDADGWVHTGDLGVMDADGYVRITGRLKDMIIRGGENIYPREIEAVIFTHPAVADVAVFGAPDERWGEIVCVALRPTDPINPPTTADLQAYCRASLAPFKTPAKWFVCTEFPLTGSGKVQKFRLREQQQAGVLKPLQP